MSDDQSLAAIISEVLWEEEFPIEESNVRRLRRSFDKLLEALGVNKSQLKSSGRTIGFGGAEAIVKTLLKMLWRDQGIATQLLKKQAAITAADIRDLIQAIIDEEAKKDVSDEELVELLKVLTNIFHHSHLFLLENCHTLIDSLATNVYDLTSTAQAAYFAKVEHILKKEFALRLTESLTNSLDIAMIIEESKQFYEDKFGVQRYCEYDAELRFEYIQRDKLMLAAIQEDDDLRYYIEKKLGQKAEDIFNYAALEG